MSSSLAGATGMRGPTGQTAGNRLRGNTATGGNIGGYQIGQMQRFTPEQMELFRSLFSHVGPESQLGRLAAGDEDIFNQIEAPAMRQFSGQLGNIASRFSGIGSGARRSSGFQNTTSQAASDFAQDLASKRQQLQRQALLDMMGISESLLGQRPYEQFLLPKEPSFLERLFGGLGNLGGQFFGSATQSAGERLGQRFF